MEINPPTKIKRIQFLGSPFQGKAAQELRERIKREKESELKQLEKKSKRAKYIQIVGYPHKKGLARIGIDTNWTANKEAIIRVIKWIIFLIAINAGLSLMK